MTMIDSFRPLRRAASALALVLQAALLVTPAVASGAEPIKAPPPAWVQFTEDGNLALRVIIASGKICPIVSVDGKAREMALRARPIKRFEGICQAPLPREFKTLTVDGTPLVGLHAVKLAPERIVIIGDTGCRIKGKETQDCNDPKGWAFPVIAQRAAARKPDLIIHVGDFLYRETPCPNGPDGAPLAGCAGSPSGDRWDTWNADFFTPVQPLLGAAPWVFVRGNHESCDRAGGGWFRFLDAGLSSQNCPAQSTPFSVSLGPGGPTLHVVDSADTDDDTAPPALVAAFAAQLDRLDATLDHGNGWIVTHRPIWGFKPDNAAEQKGRKETLPVNVTEQAAAQGRDFAGVSLILSGHVHFFSASTFGSGHPAQLIVGDGGDTPGFDEADAETRTQPIAGMPASTFVVRHYGYAVLDRKGQDWAATLYGVDDQTLATCEIKQRAITCKAGK